MILIIAVLAILSLIACVGWTYSHKSKKTLIEDGEAIIGELVQDAKELQNKIDELKAELSERPLPVQPEESEIGNFVKRRAMKHATPKIYRNVFDLDPNGRSVIDHLELRFANKSTYVRGGQDAERESCFRAGQANVISFIINQINNADNPNYKEEVNDSASK